MADKAVKIAYYNEDIEMELPEENLIGVLRPREINRTENFDECINYNLDHPIGTLPFNDACAGRKKICIIICDLTRPMETRRILPILLARLNKYAPGAEIRILIALGTHRALDDKEIDILCGSGIKEKYSVINHAFNDEKQLIKVPCQRTDIPDVYVNRLLVESDFKIGVGAVKPHPIFGWSGGAKIVIPGAAGYKTTGYSHWLSCPYRGVDIMGRVNNPIRLLYESVVVKAGLIDFLLNAILTEQCEIADVRCGHVVKAHRACVEVAEKYYIRDIDEPADAIFVGVGKWASDMWVGSNAVYQSEFYLKKGGSIILFGNFPEGLSPVHTEIARYGYRPYREIKKLVESGVLSEDLTMAAHLVHVGRVLDERKAECLLVSRGVTREEADKANLGYLNSPEEALDYIMKKHGSKARILIIPGYNSTPVIASRPQN